MTGGGAADPGGGGERQRTRALIWELARVRAAGEDGVGRAAAAEERRGLEKAEAEWRGGLARPGAQAGPKPWAWAGSGRRP